MMNVYVLRQYVCILMYHRIYPLESLTFAKSRDKNRQRCHVVADRAKQNNNKKIEKKRSE
jgi:hypothetical protein